MTTPRFGFIEWLAGTTQPDVLHNTLALKTDVFLAGGVKSRTTGAEPVSPAPSEGDCYIMPASSPVPTGASWSAFSANQIAVYYDGAWTAYNPPGRFATYVDDSGEFIVWNGSSYTVVSGGAGIQHSDFAEAEGLMRKYQSGSPLADTYEAIKSNLVATTDPGPTDNFSAGYRPFSPWLNATTNTLFFCVDDGSGASPEVAVWEQVGAKAAKQALIIAASDESTALVANSASPEAAAVTFRMPYAMNLTEVRASVGTAPTGAAIQVDIHEGGTSILSTKLTIDATEKTSTTAATPAVISDSALADDAEITIVIDQVGSTIAGAGLKITLIGTEA